MVVFVFVFVIVYVLPVVNSELAVPDFPRCLGLSDEHIHAIADGGTCLLTKLQEAGLDRVVNHIEEEMA